MTALGAGWEDEVRRLCDRVFEAADVGFTPQVQHADERRRLVSAFLWEADPTRFAEKYPDSGIVESYGAEQWPPPCIDYWVYVERDKNQCRLSVEGWSLPDLIVNVSGHGRLDGSRIAHVFARILGLPLP